MCVIKMVKKSRLTISHSAIGSLISIWRIHGNLQKKPTATDFNRDVTNFESM
jgi:hypothetical protein